MSSGSSITHWINELKEGNRESARFLWERYYGRLVQLARSQLAPNRRRVADEEDIALSVFAKFCDSAENGRFPDLSDRDSFWRLLMRMTAQKVIDRQRTETRRRRGGGAVRGESVFAAVNGITEEQALANVVGDDPGPEFAAIMSEQIRLLMDCLEDESLIELAIGKLEGYTNAELAERLDCSERTIERRLKLVRAKWTRGTIS